MDLKAIAASMVFAGVELEIEGQSFKRTEPPLVDPSAEMHDLVMQAQKVPTAKL